MLLHLNHVHILKYKLAELQICAHLSASNLLLNCCRVKTKMSRGTWLVMQLESTLHPAILHCYRSRQALVAENFPARAFIFRLSGFVHCCRMCFISTTFLFSELIESLVLYRARFTMYTKYFWKTVECSTSDLSTQSASSLSFPVRPSRRLHFLPRKMTSFARNT